MLEKKYSINMNDLSISQILKYRTNNSTSSVKSLVHFYTHFYKKNLRLLIFDRFVKFKTNL